VRLKKKNKGDETEILIFKPLFCLFLLYYRDLRRSKISGKRSQRYAKMKRCSKLSKEGEASTIKHKNQVCEFEYSKT